MSRRGGRVRPGRGPRGGRGGRGGRGSRGGRGGRGGRVKPPRRDPNPKPRTKDQKREVVQPNKALGWYLKCCQSICFMICIWPESKTTKHEITLGIVL